MLNLYKPVFWCGFALSITALYASIDRSTTDADGTGTKPPLLQIDSKLGQSESADIPELEPGGQSPATPTTEPVSNDDDAIWQSRLEKILAEAEGSAR